MKYIRLLIICCGIIIFSTIFAGDTGIAHGNASNYSIYWMIKTDEPENEDQCTYLCRYDCDTGETQMVKRKGYIIDGGIPGEGFYMVDSDSHSEWVNEWGLRLGASNKPFNLYYYSKQGRMLIYENIYFEELIKVVAYWDGVLWYIDNFGEVCGVELDTGARRECVTSFLAQKNEWIDTILPNGSLVGCVNYLPELDGESMQDDMPLLPALGLQTTDGKISILVMDEEGKYEAFRSEYYDPLSNCIYYSAEPYAEKETGKYATTDIYRYSLDDGSNTLCKIETKNSLLMQQYRLYPQFVLPDGEQVVIDVNKIVDYLSLSATEGDGLYVYNITNRQTTQIYDIYEAHHASTRMIWYTMSSFGCIEH